MEWEIIGYFLERIRAHSEDLFRHSLNVANLALHMATELGLEATTCEALLCAALLHDLGKIRIGTHILTHVPHPPVDLSVIFVHSRETGFTRRCRKA